MAVWSVWKCLIFTIFPLLKVKASSIASSSSMFTCKLVSLSEHFSNIQTPLQTPSTILLLADCSFLYRRHTICWYWKNLNWIVASSNVCVVDELRPIPWSIPILFLSETREVLDKFWQLFLCLKSSLHIQPSFCITCFKWERPSILKRRYAIKWLKTILNWSQGSTFHLSPFSSQGASCSENPLEQVHLSLRAHSSISSVIQNHQSILLLAHFGEIWNFLLKTYLHGNWVSLTIFCNPLPLKVYADSESTSANLLEVNYPSSKHVCSFC